VICVVLLGMLIIEGAFGRLKPIARCCPECRRPGRIVDAGRLKAPSGGAWYFLDGDYRGGIYGARLMFQCPVGHQYERHLSPVSNRQFSLPKLTDKRTAKERTADVRRQELMGRVRDLEHAMRAAERCATLEPVLPLGPDAASTMSVDHVR
jgi:hypothetical protein